MSNKQHHSNYTLADITDYLQGRLSPAEMHALEKAALQDPFLADALEGFYDVDAATAEEDLADIHTQLATVKNPPAKLIRTNTQNNWWKIAASIILIIGASVIAWYFFKPDTNKTELAQQTAPVTKPAPVTALPQQDTTQKTAENTPVISQQKIKHNTATLKEAKNDILADTLSMYEMKPLPPPEPQTLTAAGSLQMKMGVIRDKDAARTVMPQPGNVYYHSGTIVDSNAKPVSGAVISLGDKSIVADNNGKFSFNSADSLQQVQVTALNFKPKKIELSPERADKIVLDEDKSALNEVVIVGAGTKRRSGKANDALYKKVPAIDVSDSSIRPATGWVALKAHLDSSIQRSSANANMNKNIPRATRAVAVELLLNASGKPVNVTILSSNTGSLNQVIIDAVKKGPVWVNPDGSIATGRKKTILNF